MTEGTPRDPVFGSGRRTWPAAVLAATIAAAAWAGLLVNVYTSDGKTGSLALSVWVLLRFFTIITNVLVAVLFTGIAARQPRFADPHLIAALALSIMLVGIIYKLLLEDLYHLNGIALLADRLLHRVTPILVPLFWLLFVPKGRLRWTDPLLWTLYPLGYFFYALLRGAFDGLYPYPFMDVSSIGWPRTGINALVIALGFVAVGFFWVWLDRILSRWRRTGA